jgi:sigma-E factor negative regulatory protein RseB
MILNSSNMTRQQPCCSIFLVSVLCISLTAAFAEDRHITARELIDRMSIATRELNYEGIFIYRRDSQMDTMRLIHKYDEEGETERLVSLTGHPREVIRNKQSVTCIFPDNKSIMVEKSRSHKLLSAQLPDSIDKITEHYEFFVAGEDRIAGKDTWIVVIDPKDEFRYGYRLWLDKTSSLLLKSELNGEAGIPVEQILFTQLDILETIPDALLQPSMTGSGYTWYNTITIEHYRETNGTFWKTQWMPSGFYMSNYEQKVMVEDEDAVEHMVYTDGLALVSVFIGKPEISSGFTSGPLRMGAINAFSEMTNGYQVTAVGEVPQATVRKMATSVVTGR